MRRETWMRFALSTWLAMSGSRPVAVTRHTPQERVKWKKTLHLINLICRYVGMPIMEKGTPIRCGRSSDPLPATGTTTWVSSGGVPYARINVLYSESLPEPSSRPRVLKNTTYLLKTIGSQIVARGGGDTVSVPVACTGLWRGSFKVNGPPGSGIVPPK